MKGTVVSSELVKLCPDLENGIDFTINSEGRIIGNVSLDVIHSFLDRHCPDKKFLRTGPFRDKLAQIVKDDTHEVDEIEHGHFCEAMGITNKPKEKRKTVVRTEQTVHVQSLHVEKVMPDLATAVIVYIQIGDKLHSITAPMFHHVLEDIKMIGFAQELKHLPNCVFMTAEGMKSSEPKRPVYQLIDDVLILQEVGHPSNKIRKAESSIVKACTSVVDGTVIPSTIYVYHDGILYSMKLDQFECIKSNMDGLSDCKKLKHYPTCVSEEGGTLYSNDAKRPMYIIVEGELVLNLQLVTV